METQIPFLLSRHVLNVTKEDAIACVKFQNRLMSESDILAAVEMIDQISSEIDGSAGEFVPQNYIGRVELLALGVHQK